MLKIKGEKELKKRQRMRKNRKQKNLAQTFRCYPLECTSTEFRRRSLFFISKLINEEYKSV